MTLLSDPPKPPLTAGTTEADALFKEARRRRRRRYLVVSVVIAVVVGAVAIGLSVGRQGPTGRPPSHTGHRTHLTHPALPAPSQRGVKRATIASGRLTPIQGIGWADQQVGWAMNDDLSITTDGGRSFHTVTPPLFDGQSVDSRILTMVAVGTQDLWLPFSNTVGVLPPGQTVDGSVRGSGVLRSTDGGQSWALSTLPGCLAQCGGNVALSFPNAQIGFAATGPLESGYGPSFLFSTTDGGATWHEVGSLPHALGSRITFTNALDGWYSAGDTYFVGGGGGDPGPLYRTIDGGHTWQPAPGLPVDDVFAAPTFFGSNDAVMLGQSATRSSGYHLEVFTTQDGGAQWVAQATPAGASAIVPAIGGGIAPFSAISPTTWKIFTGLTLFATDNAGVTWSHINLDQMAFTREGISAVFSTALDGTAALTKPGCTFDDTFHGASSSNYCVTALYATTDGGLRWSPKDPVIGPNHWLTKAP